MCLIVFSFQKHAGYPLIFAGNRDEFHQRPAEAAQFWNDHPQMLAGRDLEAGGTWLGVTKKGRFATVTNYREPGERRTDARSRGDLVTNFLFGSQSPQAYLEEIRTREDHYNGFNLIFGTSDRLFYYTNRGDTVGELKPGIYGLSNEQLDTPWPKVRRAKALFHKTMAERGPEAEALLELLFDRQEAPENQLPDTGIGRQWERALSSIFIEGIEYGTRASTVVVVDATGNVTFAERTYGPAGEEQGTETFRFQIDT